MPTYTYACRVCGHTFDVVQSMKDDSLTACPRCGGELRKVFAPPAISFKGSGFYATDHGKKAKKPAAAESKGSESEGSESKGSESKGSESKGSGEGRSGDKGGASPGAKESSPSGNGSGSDGSKKKGETSS